MNVFFWGVFFSRQKWHSLDHSELDRYGPQQSLVIIFFCHTRILMKFQRAKLNLRIYPHGDAFARFEHPFQSLLPPSLQETSQTSQMSSAPTPGYHTPQLTPQQLSPQPVTPQQHTPEAAVARRPRYGGEFRCSHSPHSL